MEGDGTGQSAQVGLPSAGALDRDELIGEAERYLAAVDLFRSLGHEPNWRREAARVGSHAGPPRP